MRISDWSSDVCSSDLFHALKVGRLRKLESLSLADQLGPGQWAIAENAEATLRQLGERGDIIKRIHRGLTEHGIERGASSYVLAGESLDDPRSEEHTSEIQSLMRISYAVFCSQKKKNVNQEHDTVN